MRAASASWSSFQAMPLRRVVAWAAPIAAAASSIAASDLQIQIGSVTLEQVFHDDSLTGPQDHFGCLLFDPAGRLVRHDGNKTWMYTGDFIDSRWVSFAREFDLDTLQVGPRSLVLPAQPGDLWGTIHTAIQVRPGLTLTFFSTSTVVRAAVGTSPNLPFTADPDFVIAPSQAWELGARLEADGGHVTVADTPDALRMWLLYDTLAPGASGDNGWADVLFDKHTSRFSLLGKHPDNPIDLRLPGRVAARTGGNVEPDLSFDGLYPLLYLSKPDAATYTLGVALSEDPLFQSIVQNTEVLTGGRVIEKFQSYWHDGKWHVIYETSFGGNDWRTGLRVFVPVPEPPAASLALVAIASLCVLGTRGRIRSTSATESTAAAAKAAKIAASGTPASRSRPKPQSANPPALMLTMFMRP